MFTSADSLKLHSGLSEARILSASSSSDNILLNSVIGGFAGEHKLFQVAVEEISASKETGFFGLLRGQALSL